MNFFPVGIIVTNLYRSMHEIFNSGGWMVRERIKQNKKKKKTKNSADKRVSQFFFLHKNAIKLSSSLPDDI